MNVTLNPYQEDFIFSTARYPALVSAWGTGKTMAAILRGARLTEKIPRNLGLVIREDFTDLRDSTIRDFEQYTGWKVRSNKDFTHPNGSVIMFRHGSELKKLQNINLGWFLIEQGEEFENSDAFDLLRGRLRRKNVPFRTGFVIANTKGHNWIYNRWKKSQDEDYPLFEAKSFDNAHNLPADFIADLKKMEIESPAHYRRYVLNSWDETDIADAVLQYQEIEACFNLHLNDIKVRRVIGYDAARFGDDASVAYALEGGRAVEKMVCRKFDNVAVAHEIHTMAMGRKPSVIAGESIGMPGVFDTINKLKPRDADYTIQDFVPGKPSDNPLYNNLRTEAAFHLADLIRNRDVSIDPNDHELIEDLLADRYDFAKEKQRRLLPKQKIKEYLGGRSPDSGDAFKIAVWALRFARDELIHNRVEQKDRLFRRREHVGDYMAA